MARMVRRFRLKPNAYMTIAAPISEIGMATSGTSAVRTEPRNRKTTTRDDQDGLGQRLRDLLQRRFHEHRAVVGVAHVDVLGQRRTDAIHLRRIRCATSISFVPISGQSSR